MIRSVKANAADAQLCMRLAQSAVHGCMAGMTSFIAGVVHNRMVYALLLHGMSGGRWVVGGARVDVCFRFMLCRDGGNGSFTLKAVLPTLKAVLPTLKAVIPTLKAT
jgi:hypothetical protein